MFPISKNTVLNIVGFVYSNDEKAKESWTATGTRAEVQAAFAEFEPTVRKTVDLMNENPSKWVLNDRELLDQWVFGNGKIVLMGDAAHAVSIPGRTSHFKHLRSAADVCAPSSADAPTSR